MGWPAQAKKGEFPGIYRTRYFWKETPLVTVMIPNKDHIGDLEKCLAGIGKEQAYPRLEILIIENNSTDPATFEYYEKLKKEDNRIKIVYYKGEFNYSAINNFGAEKASGDYFFLLNNDTEFITPDVVL